MSGHQRHRDVAAYALGTLEPSDTLLFERHLAECLLCAVRLIDLEGTALALGELAGLPAPPGSGAPARDRTPERPGARLLEGLVSRVAVDRRRRRRRTLLVSTAAALAVAVPMTVFAARGGPAPDGRGAGVTTGVVASARSWERPWGTEVALRISGARWRGVCRLVAIDRDGGVHPVLSWTADGAGKAARADGTGGTEGQGREVSVTGGTDLPRERIARWQVRSSAGEPLLTLAG
ncbi:hypothetical protein ABT354_01095 [Streptomyces sp. NPDC000594]|uniref:hypothetical protein n=1 Tax=Streptomyces sp. NPDC000594 TaxID=3154261 RepID=UPI0033200F7E